MLIVCCAYHGRKKCLAVLKKGTSNLRNLNSRSSTMRRRIALDFSLLVSCNLRQDSSLDLGFWSILTFLHHGIVNERTNLCLFHSVSRPSRSIVRENIYIFYSLWRSTYWVVKHRVRDTNWSFCWLWRLSSVSITEDWALFVRRTFIFLRAMV